MMGTTMPFVRAKKRGDRTYYYLVEGVREGDKVKQRVLRYLGPADHLGRPPSIPTATPSALGRNIEIESSVPYGSAAALHALAAQLHLADAVNSVIPKGGGSDLGKLFELMVINRCIEPRSRHALPSWYSRTALPRLLQLPADDVTEDVLYNALGYFTDERVTRIQQKLWTTLQQQGADTSRIFYDLTSTYFEGHTVALAAYGYSRDHRPDKLQINLGVAVNPQGYPVTHTVLKGNVADVTTIAEATGKLHNTFNVKEAILVVDRGLISDENRQDLIGKQLPYIAGLPMNPKLQRFLCECPEDKFVQADEQDPRYFVQEQAYEQRRVVIVWNKHKQKDDAEWRAKALKAAEADLEALRARIGKRGLKTKREVLEKARRVLKKRGVTALVRLTVNRQGPPRLAWAQDTEALASEAKWDGKWVIETSTSLPAAEVFWAYHERDVVEKFMQSMKSIVDLRPVFVHKDTHVKAHVFVCVTSVLLLQVLREKLKKAGLDFSAVRGLEALESVMEVAVRQGEELQRLLTRRTGVQQGLLDVIGVSTAL